MWDLIESVPDHCLSFYFTVNKSFEFPAVNQLFLNAVSIVCPN